MGSAQRSVLSVLGRRWICKACDAFRIRTLHTVPKLSIEKDVVKRNGLHPLFSAEGFDQAWRQRQQYLLDQVNDLIKGTRDQSEQIFNTVIRTARQPDQIALYNAASQAVNNWFFFNTLKRPGYSLTDVLPATIIPSRLNKAIKRDFGSVLAFRELMFNTALALFGSGWVWLIVDDYHRLHIVTTINGGSPWDKDALQVLDPITMKRERLFGGNLEEWIRERKKKQMTEQQRKATDLMEAGEDKIPLSGKGDPSMEMSENEDTNLKESGQWESASVDGAIPNGEPSGAELDAMVEKAVFTEEELTTLPANIRQVLKDAYVLLEKIGRARELPESDMNVVLKAKGEKKLWEAQQQLKMTNYYNPEEDDVENHFLAETETDGPKNLRDHETMRERLRDIELQQRILTDPKGFAELFANMLRGEAWLPETGFRPRIRSEIYKKRKEVLLRKLARNRVKTGGPPAGRRSYSVQPVIGINCWDYAWLHDFGPGGKEQYLEAWWESIDWYKALRNTGWREKDLAETVIDRKGRRTDLR